MEIKNLSSEAIKHDQILLNEIENGIGEVDLNGNLNFMDDAGFRRVMAK